MIYFCAQKNRRVGVLQSAALNGVDYLEVLGDLACGHQLAVTFLKDARFLALTSANFLITGGTPVSISSIEPASNDEPLVVTINLNGTGDFSTYNLTIVAGPGIADPPDGLDPQLSSVDFSFKAGCPTPADCLPNNCCPSPVRAAPDINYLAKDYEGFRQVMLDRLAVLSPNWTETHAADLGIAMVETLAYAADHLSYQQDSVSTEAYIGTARNRISLRRHARLVDYRIGEGCNARVWVCLTTKVDNLKVPVGTRFYVRSPGLPTLIMPDGPADQKLAASPQPVFTSLSEEVLHAEQNSMDFYTWGDSNCCLPRGATEATLVGNLFSLAAGDVLIFEEKLGPKTGDAADADPTRRCAVRLTSVSTTDFKQRPLVDPLYNNQPITHITWSLDDALPFPICISSTIGSDLITGVSIAHGNIVPADHGLWISSEPLGQVPETPLAPLASAGCNCASRSPITTPRPFYYPELTKSPLTFAVGYDPTASASAFLSPDVSAAIPQINLQSADNFTWSAAPDLLSSLDNDRVFVPEIDQDGTVFLRFGDGLYGMAPDPNLAFFATYRVGNGTAGNIGRDTLGHIRFPGQPATLSGQTISEQALSEIEVHNPLSGAGGVDPENMEHIRQYAPFAFQSQERCVTAEDYGQAAAQSSDIREARGTLRWTGSWYTAFVSIDPVSALTTKLMADTTRRLDLLRMMGTDLAVEGAVIVGLLIEMEICVDPEHFQGDVFGALMQVFVSGDQCDGQSGILNASNFTFGETVYASPLIAAAQSVEGVISVTLSTFTRMDDPSIDGVAQGFLAMGRLEIPHCDNDPNHLDRGQFILHLDGGK